MLRYLILFCFAAGAHADVVDYKCVPNVDDYDYVSEVNEEGSDAIVWWCDEPDGLYRHYFAGQLGVSSEKLQKMIMKAGRDPVGFLMQITTRTVTEDEQVMIDRLERAHEPHCYVDAPTALTTAVLTSTSQQTVGPSKVDAKGKVVRILANMPVACMWRLSEPRRYCLATGQPDTVGRMIETDGWVPCRMERAPAKGW